MIAVAVLIVAMSEWVPKETLSHNQSRVDRCTAGLTYDKASVSKVPSRYWSKAIQYAAIAMKMKTILQIAKKSDKSHVKIDGRAHQIYLVDIHFAAASALMTPKEQVSAKLNADNKSVRTI